MRDAEIMRSQQQMADAVNFNMMQTARTISRIGARLTALERLLFGHRLSLLRMALLCLISPQSVIDSLNIAERKILQQLQEDAKAKFEKKQAEEQKPNLLLPKGGLVKV